MIDYLEESLDQDGGESGEEIFLEHRRIPGAVSAGSEAEPVPANGGDGLSPVGERLERQDAAEMGDARLPGRETDWFPVRRTRSAGLAADGGTGRTGGTEFQTAALAPQNPLSGTEMGGLPSPGGEIQLGAGGSAGSSGGADGGAMGRYVRGDGGAAVYAGLRRGQAAAGAIRRETVFITAPAEAPVSQGAQWSPAELDRCFQRDARRYSGAFTLF